MNNYFLIILMTIIGSFASYFLKKSSQSISQSIIGIFLKPSLVIGILLYLISSLINIYVLKLLPYSIVLPLTSLTYVWTMIISYFQLKEIITKRKIIGVLSIGLGVLFLAFA
ncbi:MAG: EamA family transporter [Eubacteriales bacterium]